MEGQSVAPGTVPIASVIVPAHQEQATIGACLRALLGGAGPGELQVVVVANGCTDATAEVARRTAAELGHPVVVLELAEGSKPKAIRAGEELGLALPRIYLDADVVCPTTTVRALLRGLEDGADLAVPARVLDTSAATPLARTYYRAWSSLPWVHDQLAGRGVVAVSAALRATFGEMPDVIADDRFLTTRVPRDRATIVAQVAVVRPATRLRDVVRVRRRIYQGNRAVDAPTHDAGLLGRSGHLVSLLRSPDSWPGVAVLVGVTLVAKLPWPASRWARDHARGGVA